jgi:polyvinyl alcohol dehydrogenase (cytochrome)
MTHSLRGFLLTVTVALSWLTPALGSGDVGIASHSLDVRGGVRPRVTWLAKRDFGIHKGPGMNTAPPGLDGTFEVLYADDPGNRARFIMPAPWRKNSDVTASYLNLAAPGGAGGVRMARVTVARLARVQARSLGDGDVLDLATGPGANGVVVVLTINNAIDGTRYRMCSRFPAVNIRYRVSQSGPRLRARNGIPTTCPTPATSEPPCPSWPMYGATLARTFSAPCPTSIGIANVLTLLPAWSFDTQKTVTASPSVADGVVYVGDWAGIMYAINAIDGSEKWRHQTPPAPGAAFGPIVSSAAVVDLPTRRLVIFGAGPRLYALDASNGSAVWTRYVGALDGNGNPILANDPTEIESSPLVWNDTVYVGMDTHNRQDEDSGGIRGGLLALDVNDGSLRWKFEPELGAGEGCGGMWSSPVLDPTRGLVYMATANCEKDPSEFVWTPHVEAVTAVDADTGLPVWSFQPHPQNRLDVDFGATPNLFRDSDGREVLGAGNKDAVYYALDPDSGDLFWSTPVALPGNIMDDFAVGGFIGSPATLGGRVFGGTALGGPPYFHALDGRTGAIAWQDFTASPSYAPTGTANGLVFHGALDNTLRAYDAATGLIVYATALQGPISSGPAIVGDSVYIGSGTSSSDACRKPADDPLSEVAFQACIDAFNSTLGTTGAVHALRLVALP